MKRDSLPARLAYRFLDNVVGPLVERHPVKADTLTLLGLGLSLLAGGAVVLSPPLGGLLLLAAGACDLLDGFVARRLGTASPAGAFFDSVLDRYGELAILAGAWGWLYRQGFPVVAATMLCLLALSGSLLVSYARARGEGLGVSCTEGFFQRPERILLLAAALLTAPLAPDFILPAALLLVGAGSHFTAFARIKWIRKQLTGLPPA